LGKKNQKKCLDAAKQMGCKVCCLESAPQLKAAVHIYESFGFKHLKKRIGKHRALFLQYLNDQKIIIVL